MNVRFPKGTVPVIETTKTDRRTLHEAEQLLRTIGLTGNRADEVKAADTIQAFLVEQEATNEPVVG